MKLLSVNVGRPREMTYRDRRDREKTTTTAIFKQPVSGRLRLGATNLDGDGQQPPTEALHNCCRKRRHRKNYGQRKRGGQHAFSCRMHAPKQHVVVGLLSRCRSHESVP